LFIAQRQQGHLTLNAMRHVADVIGCTPADVEDVVSYYVMFFTRPVGKYVLQVCRTLSCALMGAERVTEELSNTLGIKAGETDAAREFTLLEVECLGACDKAPVIGVNDDWHECHRPKTRALSSKVCRCDGGAASLTGCHYEGWTITMQIRCSPNTSASRTGTRWRSTRRPAATRR
jgi:NADH-quinone oxidoreductase subunit E